jgi:hypothetical protein
MSRSSILPLSVDSASTSTLRFRFSLVDCSSRRKSTAEFFAESEEKEALGLSLMLMMHPFLKTSHSIYYMFQLVVKDIKLERKPL